jgi:hypothetical protein
LKWQKMKCGTVTNTVINGIVPKGELAIEKAD